MKKFLLFTANLFLVAFLADGVISVLDEVLKLAFDSDVVSGIRWQLATWVFVAAFPGYLLMGLTPILPKRILVLPVTFFFWANLAILPLEIYLDITEWVALFFSVLEIAVGVNAFVRIRAMNGGEGWLIDPDRIEAPGFRLRNTLGFGVVNLLIILPASLLYLFIFAALGVNHATGGYVVIDHDSLDIMEREFVRDGQRVTLVGMVHIGEKAFYVRLLESFGTEGTIILQEGVSDTRGLFEGELFYKKVASAIGLDTQEEFDLDREALTVRNADIDLTEVSAVTLELLNSTNRLFDPATFSTEALLHCFELFSDMEKVEIFFDDLIKKRNAHLFGVITESVDDFDNVIVPWGAAHLKEIEENLLDSGFSLSRSRKRTVFSYGTLFGR